MTFLESTNPVVMVSGSAPILSTGGPTPVISIEDSSIDQKGAVQLEDSYTSSSITKAATPKSVKDSYDYITSVSGNLQINIDGKSDIGHDHNELYYTESEVDSLIATISGTSDDHSNLSNLDYDSSGHTGFQPSGDYLTDTEFSTYSGTLQSQIDGKSDTSHLHDGWYYTESEVDTISGSLQIDIDGKSDTGHLHDDRYYTESEVDDFVDAKPDTLLELSDTPAVYDTGKYLRSTISGTEWTTVSGGTGTSDHSELSNLDYASSEHTGFQPSGDYITDTELTTVSGDLQTYIDGKSDVSHLHDDRYYTESEVDTISGSLQTNIDGKSDTGHLHDDRYYTELEVDTISGSLQTNIDNKPVTLLGLSDTPSVYDTGKYLRSTTSGAEWTTVSGGTGTSIHSELSNLDYASSGHTGFQPAGDYVTDVELTTVSGDLQTDIDSKSDTGHSHNDLYYTESEVDTISGSLQTGIDGKSDTSHLHDDRYYTESEVDTISGSLQTNFTSIADISNYANSPMIVTGGEITRGTNVGTFKVDAFTALIRKTDSPIGELAYVTKAEENNIGIPLADTFYYVIVNYNDGSPTISLITVLQAFNDDVPIGSVMKDISNTVYYISGCYRLQDGVAKLHYRAFELHHLQLTSGNTIAYSGTNNFTMSVGVIYEGINRLTQGVYNSATDAFQYIYRDDADGWTTVSGNAIDYLHYDDGTGTLAVIGNAKYGCHWVYRDVGGDDAVYVLYGRESYLLAGAETAQIPTRPDYLTNLGCLIGKIITPQAGGSFTSVQMVTDTIFTGATVPNHNDLGGLNAGDYQHLSAAEKTDLTDGNDSTAHKHDSMYYTEDEVDDLITTISGKLDDHNELNNLDYASSGHTGFQASGDYATGSELTTLSGNLQIDIDGKSDISHLHDDQYYTESEVDTISGSLQNYTETGIDALSEVLTDYSDYKSTNSFLSKDLLIYYGYPSSFNSDVNGWDTEKVARDMAQYNIIIFGNGVAAIGHTDYANFITIVTRIKILKPGIMLFGYVTSNQILSAFQTQADEWDAVSQIDGIFMDEAGYDYGVTRAEFNDCVNYTHSLNCNICFANAWIMEHIIGITNDVSYPNSTYNPTVTPSELTENDWYLLESYPCNTTSYSGTDGYCVMGDWLSRGTKAVANRDEFGINLASVSVIDKDDPNDTILFDFHYLTTFTFSLDAHGSSHVNYGASVPTIPFYTRINWSNMGLTYETNPSVTVATDNWQIHYRYTDKGRMVCDYTGSDPIITFDNNCEDVISTHIVDLSIHRELDDTISGTENLWSANKIVNYTDTVISDTTYSGSWDGVTTVAPSKNAVHAIVETLRTRVVVVKCIADNTALTTGDGKAYFTVPVELNEMSLVSAGVHVYTVSSSGVVTFQIHNLTQAVDMFSTLLTIDVSEKDSKDATTSVIIDTVNDGIATGDELRFDCDTAGTDTEGMEIRMGFQLG